MMFTTTLSILSAASGAITSIVKIFDSKKNHATKRYELLMSSFKDNSIPSQYIIESLAKNLCGMDVTYDMFVNMLKNKHAWTLIDKFEASIDYINFDNNHCSIKTEFIDKNIKLDALKYDLLKIFSLIVIIVIIAAVSSFVISSVINLIVDKSNYAFLNYFLVIIVSYLCGIVAGFCFTCIRMKRNLKDAHEFVVLYNDGLKSNQKYYY